MPRGLGRTTALGLSGLLLLAACQPIPKSIRPAVRAKRSVSAQPARPTPTVASTGSWKLVGGDEFDGGAVDPVAWKRYHNTYGDGNDELACLTPENLVESSGTLKITARKQVATCPNGSVRQYTSGFIGSREVGRYFPRYGRFEIRAKVPHAQGLWPAFWLRHRDGSAVAEVDILEYFHSQSPGRSLATLHLDGRSNVSKDSVAFEASRSTSAWHVWAVEISPDPAGVRFEFFMDGTSFHRYVDQQHDWSSADPDATWDIAVNLAVGGRWVGAPDDTLGYLRDLNRCSIAGAAPSGCVTTGINRVDWNDPAASTYEVDYVRVYTR